MDSSAVPKLVPSLVPSKELCCHLRVVSLVWSEDVQLHVINLNLLSHACFDLLRKEVETVPSLSFVASTSYSWQHGCSIKKRQKKSHFLSAQGRQVVFTRHTVEL